MENATAVPAEDESGAEAAKTLSKQICQAKEAAESKLAELLKEHDGFETVVTNLNQLDNEPLGSSDKYNDVI